MAHKCNQHILEALKTAHSMLELAANGEADADDDSCILLYAIVRDCAFRIIRQAEAERTAHIAKGIWDLEEDIDGMRKIS